MIMISQELNFLLAVSIPLTLYCKVVDYVKLIRTIFYSCYFVKLFSLFLVIEYHHKLLDLILIFVLICCVI